MDVFNFSRCQNLSCKNCCRQFSINTFIRIHNMLTGYIIRLHSVWSRPSFHHSRKREKKTFLSNDEWLQYVIIDCLWRVRWLSLFRNAIRLSNELVYIDYETHMRFIAIIICSFLLCQFVSFFFCFFIIFVPHSM